MQNKRTQDLDTVREPQTAPCSMPCFPGILVKLLLSLSCFLKWKSFVVVIIALGRNRGRFSDMGDGEGSKVIHFLGRHSEEIIILESWRLEWQGFNGLNLCRPAKSLSFTMFFLGVRCRISSRWWALHPCTQPWTAPWMRWKTGWGESQGRLSGPDHSRMFRLHVDTFLKFVLGMISDLTRDDEQKRGPCSWLVGNLLWSIKCKRVDVLKQTPGWTLMEIGSRKDWVAEAVAWKSAPEINIHRRSRWKQQVS